MSKALLEDLERAIRQRNPTLAQRLRPGLPESRIRKMMAERDIAGVIDPIVALFAWKNGSRLDPKITLEQSSPFPASIYTFMDLEMMIQDFIGFKEVGAYHPKYTEVVDRYFPIFWDGSTGYLALDLEPSGHNRVVLLDPESEAFVSQAYLSFEEFLKDAIRANEENDRLKCFKY